MKKVFIKCSICALIAMILFVPSRARAFDLGIGYSVWYAGWQPAFKDYLLDKNNFFMPKFKTYFEINSAGLNGPVLILRFNDRVSWNTAFYVGRFIVKGETIGVANLGPASSGVIPNTIAFSIWKYDLDSMVNIKLLKFLSLFTGAKYQHYTYSMVKYMVVGSLMKWKSDIEHNGIGFGLGLGFNVNLVDNLYLFYNLSGLYQFALQTNVTVITMSVLGPIPLKSDPQTINSHGWGGNTTLTLAYYIAPARTTLSLGFRYQVILFLDKSMNANNFQMIEGKYDHFYGILFTAAYTFNFGKDKEVDKG